VIGELHANRDCAGYGGVRVLGLLAGSPSLAERGWSDEKAGEDGADRCGRDYATYRE
jgi:hypothetical protein